VAPVTFSSQVNLVSVPVVVKDHEGRAVGNFQQEDFQLFDSGKLQVITKFSLEKAGTLVEMSSGAKAKDPIPLGRVPPAVPDRYVAYLFDDLHLEAADSIRVRQAADRHVSETLDPAARAAVFTTSGRVTLDFTDDRQKLRDAIQRIPPAPPITNEILECPDISPYQADLIINKGDSAAFEWAVAETRACYERLPRAAWETIARSTAMSVLHLSEGQNRDTLAVAKGVVRRLSEIPGSRTVVLVSPGFVMLTNQRADEMDLIDRSIRAHVTINTLDTRGLLTLYPTKGDLNPQTLKNQYFRDSALVNSGVLIDLADGTGGSLFQHDNGFQDGFKQLASRPEYFYVLGFSPQNLKFDGSYHNLKVTLKNGKDVTLQVRGGYWAPNHAVDPAEAALEELREVVFSRDEIQGIPVDVQAEFFIPSDAQPQLTVISRLDIKGIRFLKTEDRNNDTLTVVTGLFDQNGNYISGIQRVLEMHLQDQTRAALETSGITLKESFSVAPGRYIVRVVVRDTGGQTMAARNAGVEIP
jgi:VWFA-related protein